MATRMQAAQDKVNSKPARWLGGISALVAVLGFLGVFLFTQVTAAPTTYESIENHNRDVDKQERRQEIIEKKLTIDADVYLYQSDQDPVVEPSSVGKLRHLITANNISVVNLSSETHGVVYQDIDQVQQKICASIPKQVK